jgi:hypothetical protein
MMKSLNIKTKYLISIALIMGILFVGFIYFKPKPEIPRQPIPTATIKNLPAQPNPASGDKNVQSATGSTKGTAKDLHGQPSNNASTDPSNWAQSKSGNLTLKQPLSGGLISDGANVTGSANVGKVQYRLIDDQSGVISQSSINVVDGNFAATISYQHKGSTGRLDVFSTNPDGTEINEVQIPVKFGS